MRRMAVSNYKDPSFVADYKKETVLNSNVAYPALLDTIGDISNKQVLDLGCGAGNLARRMAENGGVVVGVDPSDVWIAGCKQDHAGMNNLRFMVADGADLSMFEDQSFDIVVMNMVLLNIPSEKTVQAVLSEIARVLKPSGELLFTDLHPLGLMIPKTACETQSYPDGFSYFKDGANFRSSTLLMDETSISFSDIHWTLEAITGWLDAAGLCISRLIEPLPVKGGPSVLEKYDVPEILLFVCKKH